MRHADRGSRELTEPMLLEFVDVAKRYGDRPVLDGFSLQVVAGEHVLLLGPSGSGKTTLLHLVCGLLTPDRGAISVAGERIDCGSAAKRDDVRRRRIGIVFQALRLVSALDVRANLLLAQRLAGRARDAQGVDALIERLGLAHSARARPRELSQGEAQRAAIARALVGRPDLLVADEPTSALDDDNAGRVGRLLLDATAETGSTLLVATHDARMKALIGRSVSLTVET